MVRGKGVSPIKIVMLLLKSEKIETTIPSAWVGAGSLLETCLSLFKSFPRHKTEILSLQSLI